MKYLKFLIIVIIVSLSTGCWNYRELNQLTMVMAIGIDKEGNEYNVSVQTLNSKRIANTSGGSGNSTESPVFVYSRKAKTIKQAIEEMPFTAPYELYIGHVSLVVISDEVAREGLDNFIDYLMRDRESRKIFPIIVIKNGKAIDALKILTPLDIIPAVNIKDSLQTTDAVSSMVSDRSLDEFLMCLYMEGRSATMSSAKIIGNKKEQENNEGLSKSSVDNAVVIDGSAVFKKSKLIGYLNEEESANYTVIRGKSKTLDITFPCDNNNNYALVVLSGSKTLLKPKIINNKPQIAININGSFAISEYNCKMDFGDLKNIKKIEKMANKELTKRINTTIKKVQNEYGSDIFGFGERFYKQKYSYWKKNKKNWDKIFKTLDYKVKVNLKADNIGSTNNSVKTKGED